MRVFTALQLAVVFLVAGVSHAQPYRYELTIIDQVSNSTTVRLEDVNSDGVVVGWANFSGQPARGFTWTEAGGVAFLPSPEHPPLNVRPKGISTDGLICATATRDLGGPFDVVRAHVWDPKSQAWAMIHPWAGCTSEMQAMSPNGHYCGEVQHLINTSCGHQSTEGEGFAGTGGGAQTLGNLSQFGAWAHAVNNLGHACGESYIGDGSQVRGYYKPDGGVITQLPGLGGNWSMAYGLNDTGDIVGYASRPGDDEWVAVRWARVGGAWAITDMTPDHGFSTAWDVNNSGQVVGTFWDGTSTDSHACIWVGPQRWNLNDLVNNPSGVLTEATAISETGWIVGNMRHAGETKRFILKPVDQDSDGDGLLDSWETLGIPYTDDEGEDQLFPLPDADPMHKDLYVEVDAMEGFSLSDGAVAFLEAAFAGAPLENPDGQSGITLHIQRDQTDLLHEETWDTDGCWPLDFDDWRSDYYGTTEEFDQGLLGAKAKAYRYCIVADKGDNPATEPVESVGGCGLTPGDSFVIFLGSGFYDDLAQAAVFMHELGHNLGLHHGGCDSVNGKPNYPSIMNYVLSYKYQWNAAFWRLDFSRGDAGDLPVLNEASLDENAGIGDAGNEYSAFKMPFGVNEMNGEDTVRAVKYVSLDGSATDFGNLSGTMFQDGSFDDGVSQDLNFASNAPAGVGIPGVASFSQPHTPHDDWANIGLALASTLGDGAPAPTIPEDELTNDAREWIDDNFPMPPGTNCVADLSGDNVIDVVDLLTLLGEWGPCGACPSDLNGDLTVDTADLLILLGNWGPC